jgi:hypothetical protein
MGLGRVAKIQRISIPTRYLARKNGHVFDAEKNDEASFGETDSDH